MDIKKIYTSRNFGDFKVVDYIDTYNVLIEFVNTGYKVNVDASQVVSGYVKDRFARTVNGVGFVGVGRHLLTIKRKPTTAYTTWVGMLARCYSAEYQKRYPTYIDCSVCDEWHNFQLFAGWYEDNYIKGFHLDKDIKIDGNRIYSPETCAFVSEKNNNIKAHAKFYEFISPLGVITSIYNLTDFCSNNSLCHSHMSSVHRGKLKQHKGWVKS